MKIIDSPDFEILENPIAANRFSMVDSARLCYKSVSSGEESDSRLLANCVKNGHWTPIEHSWVKIRFLCDRGLSHELVRHRIASFNQESTRYCNYSKDKFGKEITVLQPHDIETDSMEYWLWRRCCERAERAYFKELDLGVKPETARAVLPTCLATTIDVSANLREWYHIFDIRTSRPAHPDIRLMMFGPLQILAADYPEIFEKLCAERTPEMIEDFAKKGE